MKKRFILSIIFIVFLIVIAGCSTKSTSEQNLSKSVDKDQDYPKEVRIGYQVIPNAELLAKELGLVEKKFPDIKIKWLEFDSGRDVNIAMASGNIDLGLAGTVPIATGIANQLPYQVYFIHDVIGEAESLVVKNDLDIKSVKDLVGKKIAVPFGSTAHFSLLMALNNDGVESSKVSILDMQPQDIFAAWERGDIDGAFVWHPTLGKIIESKGRILTSAKQLSEKGIVTSDVGIVQNEFSSAYPNFIKEYVDVLDESIKLYRENPEKAAKTLASTFNLSEKQTLEQMKGLIWLNYSEQKQPNYLGKSTEIGKFANVLEDTGKFLTDQEIIPLSPDLSTYQSAIFYVK